MNDQHALKKDANRVASEVVQKQTLLPDKVSVLLVEGPDDDRVYSEFLNKALCKTVQSEGRPNLIDAAAILRSFSIDGWLGITDSDFGRFTGEQLPPNILATDDHDLEVMILNTDALDELIDDILDYSGTPRSDTVKKRISNQMWDIGATIGYLHLMLLENGTRGLNFDYLTFQYLKHVSTKCELAFYAVRDELSSAAPWINESEISPTQLKQLTDNSLTHLCRGHDLTEILRVIIPRMTKYLLSNEVAIPADLHSRLLEKFTEDRFKCKDLYEKILEWEYENRCFVVLSD